MPELCAEGIRTGVRYMGSIGQFLAQQPQYRFEGLEAKLEGKEIQGNTGYAGRVSGRVRVVKNQRQAREVQAGEILVSPMTTPDFLPAMQKAAAFVTDEGGITCHAGIVAREMKKPCVIGTKIATQVLKDGDMVELDAEKGIVRILNHA